VAQPAASAEAQQAIEPAAALKYKTKDKHNGEYRKPVHHEGEMVWEGASASAHVHCCFRAVLTLVLVNLIC
jgi:hypothetical protein